MLDRLIYADWEDPPEAMAFELGFGDAVRAVTARLATVQREMDGALAAPAAAPASFWATALDLYLLTPALVNVALNFKVCVEHGLPLDPTHYFEVDEHSRGRVVHAPDIVAAAQTFFLDAIDASLAVFRLDHSAAARLAALAANIPAGVGDFVYTSGRDRYTWRASQPAKIRDLAADIRARVRPAIIVGAAHGSITSALVLATLLATPLYFIRFSMFKRNDTRPVIAPSDLRFLEDYRRGPALLFDEDIAKGTTLAAFTERLRPCFDEAYSAGVLRHATARFRPDFVGRVWYD